MGQATYITQDTEALSAEYNERFIIAAAEYAKQAKQFDGLPLPEDLARKMHLLKIALTMPAPANKAESEELTRIAAAMEGMYGKGKYCPAGGAKDGDTNKDGCLDIEEITRIMRTSREPR